MRYRLGVDIGGTFTDFILADEEGSLREAKVESQFHNPGQALLEGLAYLARERGSTTEEFVELCDLLIHGTTVATNALIQHRGARIGLLCTEGFRDTMRMRQGYKERRYDFSYPPPAPLVSRQLCVPVRERVTSSGAVLVPLEEDDVLGGIETFKDQNVDAVAICFLWSFLNSTHEMRAAELVRSHFPEAYVSVSVEVLPEIRYYDRLSTTIVNAFLGPVMQRYLANTEGMLRSLGYQRPIRYTQANGGLTSGENLRRRPIMALNSGPTAAPAAGRFFEDVAGTGDMLTIDMGGTSFDVCILEQGVPTTVKNVDVQRYRLGVPVVEVNAVGAGGGSIATVDAGLLRVGPESAESTPGPACYGKGGTEPTVTDADVILGYLNPESLLGGRLEVDKAAAIHAVATNVADPLGLTVDEASLAIFRLVNDNMVRAVKEVSVERGHDPREFALMIGGGCGPVHAASLAQDLGIRRVIIPKVAATFCAFGGLVADMRYDYGTSYVCRLGDADVSELNARFEEMEQQGLGALAADGVGGEDGYVQRFLEIRYVDQIHECSVQIGSNVLTDADLPRIEELFHAKHRTLYTYSEPDHPTELVNLRVAVSGAMPAISLTPHRDDSVTSTVSLHETQTGVRPVLFAGFREYVATPIYDGDRFAAGLSAVGPAIVEQTNTTIVVPPGAKLEKDPRAAFIMHVGG